MLSGVQRRIESNYRRNIAKVVRPDLVVRSRDALELKDEITSLPFKVFSPPGILMLTSKTEF